ncbi:MAG: hypothetical protein KAK00_08360 [Nanoarchaeota archaeon]|nr:hypothetical protein [Nanoarchaeota archaeon]
MNLDSMSKSKKIMIIALLMLPLFVSVSLLTYLRVSWQVEIAPGEMLSPIEDKPLFVGLLIFALGYLFFLGMLFSDNIQELFNKRFSLIRR